jgi:N-acetylmuramoyl-L-alanine amidase
VNLTGREKTKSTRRTPLRQHIDHSVQVGITSPKPARNPIASTGGNLLAVSNDVKLTGLSGPRHHVDTEALLNEGRETRDLGLVVLSSRAEYNLNLHRVLRSNTAPSVTVELGFCKAQDGNRRVRLLEFALRKASRN